MRVDTFVDSTVRLFVSDMYWTIVFIAVVVCVATLGNCSMPPGPYKFVIFPEPHAIDDTEKEPFVFSIEVFVKIIEESVVDEMRPLTNIDLVPYVFVVNEFIMVDVADSPPCISKTGFTEPVYVGSTTDISDRDRWYADDKYNMFVLAILEIVERVKNVDTVKLRLIVALVDS